jgi:hypothetical protein
LGNLSVDELNFELQRGAKFVVYYYCISLVVVTFRRGSDIHFIRSGESRVFQGMALDSADDRSWMVGHPV